MAFSNEPRSTVFDELWISLASLVRSYIAVHGLNGDRQATVELDENQIMVRHGDGWLNLERQREFVTWKREDGRTGTLELTEAGRLRSSAGPAGEDVEMDMAAEQWARELML
jgi:uncharacterized membrane-anchored protein